MSQACRLPLRFLAFVFALSWALGCVAQSSAGGPGGDAAQAQMQAQSIVHMLDYIAVDYPQFVRDGAVVDEQEYAEQREFAGQVAALLARLPSPAGGATQGAGAAAQQLEAAQRLLAAIDAKAPGEQVAELAGALRRDVISTYRLVVAPRQAPDLQAGARLFTTHCAACHGAQGGGDGALARGMEPAPSDFHDVERMRLRSVYGLFNTITLGVAGTTMRAFGELSEAERWALAFHAAGFGVSEADAQRGRALWRERAGRPPFDGRQPLAALVTASADELRRQHGEDAVAVQAYLIREPQALSSASPPLEVARAQLADSRQAYQAGRFDEARRLAIAAYLEGFELVESSLDNVDSALRVDIEREMMALRAAVADGSRPQQAAEQFERVEALLERAEQALGAGNLSPAAAFVSSLLILLREGLEAILVLAAIVAFVRRTGRRDAIRYIHVGWIAALLLGMVTWALARWLLTISGANRELTEGITALAAAAMLLYVGYWLHSRSHAQAWQSFIREQVDAALGKRTLWAMAGISFLAVYREMFEIVLFYEALWAQVDAGRGQMAVLGGLAAAAVLLVIIGWAILRYSVRLPIGPFFAATALLLALLAVVFVGNGVAALQEAGVLGVTPARFVSIPLLGVHPTWQGLSGQLAALLLVAAGMLLVRARRGSA